MTQDGGQQQQQPQQPQVSEVAKPENAARRLLDLTMEEANIDASNASFARRGTTIRRPGEASRQPIERDDVEAGRGVQFNTPAGTGTGGNNAMLNRKRTLIRPERQRVDPNHRNYHYLAHTQAQNMPVQASTTGNRANVPIDEYDEDEEDVRDVPYNDNYGPESPLPSPERTDLMRGKSILGRDAPQRVPLKSADPEALPRQRLKKSKVGTVKRKPKEPEREMTSWVFYCKTITFCFPGSLLRCFGIPGRMQQQAWREKIGLISVIILLGAIVGFLTFGFTQAVCKVGPASFNINAITNGYLIIQGRAYDLTLSSHPAAIGVPAKSNVLYPPVNAGGLDASFMFQNVNSKCKGLITAKSGSNILTDSNGNLGWYFPCGHLLQPDGSTRVNRSEGPYNGYACHTTANARNEYYALRVTGEVVFDWNDINNSSRNLMVYSGYLSFSVIDSVMSLI
jgi:chitin synthase